VADVKKRARKGACPSLQGDRSSRVSIKLRCVGTRDPGGFECQEVDAADVEWGTMKDIEEDE
jgi:hypothetical protein